MSNSLKNHLNAIISGKSEVRHGKIIQTIANYLRESQKTSTAPKGSKRYKEQEKQKLVSYISKNQLRVNHIDFNQYVSEGAEQKVYLSDQKSVIKLNDSIYYNSWEDYFHNLLLPEDTELIILNRWGNAVFSSTNYQNNWDGKDTSGKELADGVYTYKFTTKAGRRDHGFVTLIR